MRKVLIIIGIILLVLIVAAAIFAATFNPNQYRGQIQSELQTRLGRQVSLGNMSLGLFPPRFEVQKISIADDPKFNRAKPFVQAQELDVSVKLLPLLHKAVEVDTLNLQRPSVELIKNAAGVWNFSTIGASSETGTSGTSSKPSTSGAGSQPSPSGEKQQFSLGKLEVTDGQVAITDQQDHKPRIVYDHINVVLNDFAPDTPFTVDASVQLPGHGTQEIRLKGKGGPIAQSNPAATPFKGSLDLKDVSIADFQRFMQTPALANTDGVLSGHTNIANDSGRVSADGQMTVDKPRLRGVDVGYPITADYNVNDDLNSDFLKIDKGTIKLGPTPLYVTGTVNSKPTPAQLDLNLKANNVSIAEMTKLAAAAGTAFSPGATVTGQVNADITARGPADKPALNGTIAGRDIQASGKDIPQPVQVKAVNLALTPTEIRSDNFPVTSGSTTVNTQFSLRNYTSNVPLVDATLKAPRAELPALLSMAKAYGVSGAEKLSGSGILSLDMHAAGPLNSITADEIMRALNGNMNLDFNNVKYTGADIGHELASLGKFLNSAQSLQKDQGYTNILKMTGNILVKNGVANTNNLQALLDIANVGIAGTADLVSQRLNLDVTAVLSKGFSQQVGGTGIGGYLTTALANNQGEIVIPAIVTGTFQHPVFTPNAQKLAQMRLKGLLPSSSNPLAGGASGLLGNFLGQKNAPQGANQGQQQQQQNPVDQIIGLFGKKKKPPPK